MDEPKKQIQSSDLVKHLSKNPFVHKPFLEHMTNIEKAEKVVIDLSRYTYDNVVHNDKAKIAATPSST